MVFLVLVMAGMFHIWDECAKLAKRVDRLERNRRL